MGCASTRPTPDLQLCINATMEMHPQIDGVDMAAVSGAVDLAELGMCHKSFAGHFGQVPVAARELRAANAELALFAVWQGCQRVRIRQ